MPDITLYTVPGVSTIFLGEVQVGEGYADPVLITGQNTSAYTARQMYVGTNDLNVQLALDELGPWVATVGPLAPLAANGEFQFWARVQAPDVEEPTRESFMFTLDYTMIAEG